jgi:hypothetical protein
VSVLKQRLTLIEPSGFLDARNGSAAARKAAWMKRERGIEHLLALPTDVRYPRLPPQL